MSGERMVHANAIHECVTSNAFGAPIFPPQLYRTRIILKFWKFAASIGRFPPTERPLIGHADPPRPDLSSLKKGRKPALPFISPYAQSSRAQHLGLR